MDEDAKLFNKLTPKILEKLHTQTRKLYYKTQKATKELTSRIAITACPLVGLYDMRTTGDPMSMVAILLPVSASNSVKFKSEHH